jgi:hypothetical protein
MSMAGTRSVSSAAGWLTTRLPRKLANRRVESGELEWRELCCLAPAAKDGKL